MIWSVLPYPIPPAGGSFSTESCPSVSCGSGTVFKPSWSFQYLCVNTISLLPKQNPTHISHQTYCQQSMHCIRGKIRDWWSTNAGLSSADYAYLAVFESTDHSKESLQTTAKNLYSSEFAANGGKSSCLVQLTSVARVTGNCNLCSILEQSVQEHSSN